MTQVFEFADTYRGSYNQILGPWVCPFYCDFSGYEVYILSVNILLIISSRETFLGNVFQDELLWAAAWLFKATRNTKYWKYLEQNISQLDIFKINEFGWDSKHAGINILMSNVS